MKATELRDRYNLWHERSLAVAASGDAIAREEARFFDWVLALLGPASAATLLDVACGTGNFVRHAAAAGLRVTGVDLSDVAVGAARGSVPDAEFLVADGQELPLPDASFDHVTCLGSLEHFPEPERGAAEMARVLRPDGRALVFVPNLFFLGHIYFALRHGTQPTEGDQTFSETFRTTDGWRRLLEEAGLEVVETRTWNRIHGSQRVRPSVKWLWNAASRFVPRHGSYAFAFLCTRR